MTAAQFRERMAACFRASEMLCLLNGWPLLVITEAERGELWREWNGRYEQLVEDCAGDGDPMTSFKSCEV